MGGCGRSLLCGEDIAYENFLNICRFNAGTLDSGWEIVNTAGTNWGEMEYLPLTACEPSCIALRLARELS